MPYKLYVNNYNIN